MERALDGAPADRRETVRLEAVQAVLRGVPRAAVARRFGVTRQAVHTWVRNHRLRGPDGLAAHGRGRIARPVLDPDAEAGVIATIAALPPRQVGVPFPCWTRKAVAALVEGHHGVRASFWKLDRMLRRWGFRTQKEVRRAHRNVPPAVRARLAEAAATREFIPIFNEENLYVQ